MLEELYNERKTSKQHLELRFVRTALKMQFERNKIEGLFHF